MMKALRTKAAAAAVGTAVLLSGCGVSPYDLPLPGGANVGDNPYEITVDFRDVLDLVPQSAVRVDDIAVGKVTAIELDGWTATATLQINDDVVLPDNAEANLRQSSLLGEKFVDLAAPENPSSGELGDGDHIGLDRSGRNPDIEEVLGAASLLLNGGGLERTNTIVKELSRTLDGNEPEIKQLLQNSENFLGQLDDNKEDLLTALEKVDNLARTTQEQEGAIVAALEELPEALAVLDEQRPQLVGLLESLDGLGDAATGVIRRSKDDTLAVLRDLEPTLKGLADAGDDLATSTQVLLSFPFSDGFLGSSVPLATEACPLRPKPVGTDSHPGEGEADYADLVQNTACYGDYANLDIRLGLDQEQITNLVQGVISLAGTLTPSGDDAGSTDESSDASSATPQSTAGLVELTEGLAASGDSDGSGPQSGSDGERSSDGDSSGGFCSLLGLCRAPTTTPEELMESQDDVGRLMIGPVVAR